MITLQERAYAKLNLTLDVLGRREDGYHELESIMQLISLYDEVEIDLETGEDWTLSAEGESIPLDSDNLAWKAVGLFYRSIGKDPQGVALRILKRIPVGSGLGGGSADAAAVLRALNRHEGSPYTSEELAQLGLKLGSDVPFCIMGGTALAKGRGEKLSPVKPMPQCFYCIAMPEFSVSTAQLFQKADENPLTYRPDTPAMLAALESGDLLQAAGRVCNALEPVVAQDHREIAVIRSIMEDCGALGSAMTGSGSAVFGVFDAFDMAAMASMNLMERCKTYLSRNVDLEELQ